MITSLLKHVALPLLAPAALVGLYFTPVEVFGCATRGLIAFSLALVSAVCAVITAGLGARAAKRDGGSSGWWIASSLILILPLVLLIWPLG